MEYFPSKICFESNSCTQVDIFDPNLSDKHSPIILTLKSKPNQNSSSQDAISHETDISYEHIHSKGNEDKMTEFQSNFDQNKINDLWQLLDNIEGNTTNQAEINNIVKEVSNVGITARINANI